MTTSRRLRQPSRATAELAFAGWTQLALAGELGIPRTSIADYLTGQRTPPARFTAGLERLIGPEAAAQVIALIPPCQREAVPA